MEENERVEHGDGTFRQVEFQTLIISRESFEIYSINSDDGKSDGTSRYRIIPFRSAPHRRTCRTSPI